MVHHLKLDCCVKRLGLLCSSILTVWQKQWLTVSRHSTGVILPLRWQALLAFCVCAFWDHRNGYPDLLFSEYVHILFFVFVCACFFVFVCLMYWDPSVSHIVLTAKVCSHLSVCQMHFWAQATLFSAHIFWTIWIFSVWTCKQSWIYIYIYQSVQW